jgi:hypothetical protein
VRRGEDPATTAGTATAYTLTTDSGITSLNTGDTIAFIPHVSCGENATLNINSIGAENILINNKRTWYGDIIPGMAYYGVKVSGGIQILNPEQYLDVYNLNIGTSTLYYTDSPAYICSVATGATSIELRTNGGQRYMSGTAQTLTVTTLWASADVVSGVVVRDGYLYILLLDNGIEARIYRCLLTNDINNTGNWTQMTIAGTALPIASGTTLVGYGNGAFWVVDPSTSYIPYTLSSTTLTGGSVVNVTGSSYDGNSRVCELGIVARFGSAPAFRLANFSGTLDSTRQLLASVTNVLTTPYAVYVEDISTTSIGYYRCYL